MSQVNHLKVIERIQKVEIAFPTVKDLETFVFAAMIMAAIDDHIDETEVTVIDDFALKYWKPAFGDWSAFFDRIDQRLKDFLFPKGFHPDLKDQKQRFLLQILPNLHPNQQQALLYLMKEVMDADGIREATEVSLLVEVAQKLGE